MRFPLASRAWPRCGSRRLLSENGYDQSPPLRPSRIGGHDGAERRKNHPCRSPARCAGQDAPRHRQVSSRPRRGLDVPLRVQRFHEHRVLPRLGPGTGRGPSNLQLSEVGVESTPRMCMGMGRRHVRPVSPGLVLPNIYVFSKRRHMRQSDKFLGSEHYFLRNPYPPWRWGRQLTRALILTACAGMCPSALGGPLPSVDEIVNRMRAAETLPGAYRGIETDVVTRVGIPSPNQNDPTILRGILDGSYRWYVRGKDWWTVKEIPQVSPGYGPGTMLRIARNYDAQVLSNTMFRDKNGRFWFSSAHLDENQQLSSIGPMLGRRVNFGTLSAILRQMTDHRVSLSTNGIEIDGSYKGMSAHMTVDPGYSYLATAFTLENANYRSGFTIYKVRRVGDAWFPERAHRFVGDYSGDRLAKGYEAEIAYTEIEPYRAPTHEEAPSPPPGAILGSDNGRLYRVAQDRTLVDWGRMGQKPGAPLAWGQVFVLSGAGLLLGSLSWIVFRRKPSSPSPSRR